MFHVPTMTATVIPHVLRAARHAGIDPAATVARLRLPPSVAFEDCLPLPRIADFREAMMRLVQDPWFPIRAAAIPEHEEQSLLSMFCRAQETLGDALRSIARYSLLVTDTFLISVRVDRDHAVLAFNMPTAFERLGVRCQLEFLVCDTVGSIAGGTTFRTLLDETRFRLAREWLNHTAMPIKVVAARLCRPARVRPSVPSLGEHGPVAISPTCNQ